MIDNSFLSELFLNCFHWLQLNFITTLLCFVKINFWTILYVLNFQHFTKMQSMDGLTNNLYKF